MTQEILHAIGKAPTGELVRADHADKSVSYTCPSCAHDFVLKRGSERRAHFAHKASNPDCKPETALHHGFKTLLFAKIQHHLEQQMPLEVQWCCSHCGGTHNGNLLRKTAEVKLEHHVGDYRPDIALFDADGSVVAVIEVVVTHAPEPSALTYYRANKIAITVLKLKSDADLKRLDPDQPFLNLDRCDQCRNPKCQKCKGFKILRKTYLQQEKCFKCKNAHRKFRSIRTTDGFLLSQDIEMAKQHGVVLNQYKGITCPICSASFSYPASCYSSEFQEVDLINSSYYCYLCHRI